MATLQAALKFADVFLEVQIELGRTRLKLRDILDLRVGGVLVTRRFAAEGVDVRAGSVRIGAGRIMLSEGRVSVRLTSLDTPSPIGAPLEMPKSAERKS